LYQRQRLKDPDSIGTADPAPGKSKKWPPKKKTLKFSFFEELDVLSGGLAAELELVNNYEKKLIKHFFYKKFIFLNSGSGVGSSKKVWFRRSESLK
jgi:hypothetical protein